MVSASTLPIPVPFYTLLSFFYISVTSRFPLPRAESLLGLDPALAVRFAGMFSLHMSNFGFAWVWKEW